MKFSEGKFTAEADIRVKATSMLSKSLLKLFFALILLLAVTAVFSACSVLRGDEGDETTDSPLIVSTTQTEKETTTAQSTNDGESYIILEDENTIVSGEGASFENSVLTITKGGTYNIKGKLTDGKIYVNTDDEDKKVKLMLAGVDISCSTDAPIFIENSPRETILILSEGTENRISDTARSVPEDENADYATAAIYSKDDLQIEGSGKLYVTGNFNKGIFSKNDIDIRGGYVEINSADDGIRGKDSVEISDGNLVITSGGDGIRTSEEVEADKGNILISGGSIKVVSDLDGIQAVKNADITGGIIDITSGGGATGNISSEEMGPGGMAGGKSPGGRNDKPAGMGIFSRPGMPDSSGLEESKADTPSTKGIKAGGSLNIRDAQIKISSLDDSLHAVNITVDEGEYTLTSDDDGIHADENVKIEDGKINITNSYEGIEGRTIDIGGGEITLRSVDDGFNAAGEEIGMMQTDESCKITITDGYIHINADGDGIDSNGSVDLQDGTLIVFGPESGANGALDYGSQFTVSGGTLLALGSSGMAQSVTAQEDASVLAFRFSQSADILTVITDEDGDVAIAFTSDKQYGTVVYASEDIDKDETYSVYQGGKITGNTVNGVCMQGVYTPGELVGSLDKSA